MSPTPTQPALAPGPHAARQAPEANGAPQAPAVCQVLHTLSVGGAEVLAARLARGLRGRFRFLFACLDEMGTLGEELCREGFPVYVLGRKPGFDWRCAWRLAALLRREQVDVVHGHQYTPFFYGITARLLCRRPAVLFTEHGRHHPDYPRRKRMLANRLLLRRRDRVVAVGEAVRQALIANEGIPAGRVGVIYNGTRLEPPGAGAPDRAALRREIGVGPDDFVVMQVARLDYLKDHATAIRTLGHVARRLPGARLVLVGEGPETGKIQELVSGSGLEGRVRWLGLRRDVARLLHAADLFLLTSISEGIPVTVIEAMAAGLPVVGTRVGGMAEVVEDGTTGLLAAAGDDLGLAGHVLRLSAEPDLRRAMGRSGRERAGALFSEARMHEGYARLYQEVLHV
jgi:glycosyltransferase involved in cell wall biosynthesis